MRADYGPTSSKTSYGNYLHLNTENRDMLPAVAKLHAVGGEPQNSRRKSWLKEEPENREVQGNKQAIRSPRRVLGRRQQSLRPRKKRSRRPPRRKSGSQQSIARLREMPFVPARRAEFHGSHNVSATLARDVVPLQTRLIPRRRATVALPNPAELWQ